MNVSYTSEKANLDESGFDFKRDASIITYKFSSLNETVLPTKDIEKYFVGLYK